MMNYIFLILAVFAISVISCFLLESVTGKKKKFSEKFSISGFITMVVSIVTLLAIVIIEFHVEHNVDKYNWEAVYDKAFPIVLNSVDKVSTITDDRGEFYRFTIVNEDNEFESIFALVDDVEKLVICGVKPYFSPIKEYRCINQPKFYTWFCPKISIKPNKLSGKLIIDEDFYIENYKYELIKIE